MSLHFVASISSLVGISLALVACGSSSSSGGNGGASGSTAGTTGMSGGTTATSEGGTAANTAGTSAGGTTGSGTGGTTSSTGGTTSTGGGSGGDCALPACIAGLATSCVPSGTCVESSTDSTDPTMPSTDAQCYSNGVKLVTSTTFDLASGAVSFSSTVSKNGSTCYSFSSADGATVTIKDGSGSTVATITSDASGNSVISCGGKMYTQPANCMDTMMPGGDTTCTMGTCAP